MIEEIWHRFENYNTAPPVDEFDNPCGPSTLHVAHRTYKVLKHTPCGVWLDLGICGKRFVLSDSRKKFAAPTIEQALESFKARKKKEAKIHQTQADRARRAAEMAEQMCKSKIDYSSDGGTCLSF